MPPKKKKDKAKERAEAERRAKEEEEARRVQEELEAEERRKMELILMKDRKKQDNKERKIRVTELTEIAAMRDEQESTFRRAAIEKRKDAKWERYMRCDGTPDPTIQGDINTYISLQSNYNEKDNIHTVLKNTDLDLSLIKELEDLIHMGITDDDDITEKHVARFQETIINLDNLLQFKIDSCTHVELCNASSNADPETSNLQLCGKNESITLCIWGNLGKNLRIKNYEFKEMGFTFEIPKILALTHCAIRLLYTNYDHYSPKSRSYTLRKKVQELKEEIVQEEPKKEEEKEEEKEVHEEETAEEKKESPQDLLASLRGDLAFDGDLDGAKEEESNKMAEKDEEEEEEEEVPEYPFPYSPEFEEYEDFDEPDEIVDLRANAVVGGIYHFNLLHLPPQPNICKKWVITEVTYPPKLQFMDYVAEVVETPAETKTVKKEEAKEETKEETKEEPEKQEEKHEKVEEEGKKEEESKKEKEAKREEEEKKDKKERDTKKEKEGHVDSKRDEKPPIGITIKNKVKHRKLTLPWFLSKDFVRLPPNTLFSENPLPAMWDDKKNAWVMKGFSDIKYSEDTRMLHFKMLSFGTFALIQDYFINMPFQSWELRSRGVNWAHMTITAAVLELEFDIKDDLCCITLPAVPELSHIRDKWMKPEQLIKELQWCGVNVFPSKDASKYVSIQIKSSVLEDHVYQQISLVASAMGFSWSRWNGEAEREDIILQATECLIDEPLQEDLQTFQVNKTHITRLKLSEFDEDFSLEPVDSTIYFSNFYHLMKKTGSEQARLRIENTNAEFRDCVKKMLTATKVLTYS